MTEFDLCFVREINPDIPSKIIAWHNGLGISHVLGMYTDRDGIRKLAHSVGKGVCKENIKEFLKTHIIVKKRNIKLNCSNDYLCGHINGSLGKGYSWLQFLLILFGWKAFQNGVKKMICSEFWARIIHEESNHNILGNLDKCTPEVLWHRFP